MKSVCETSQWNQPVKPVSETSPRNQAVIVINQSIENQWTDHIEAVSELNDLSTIQ